MFTNVRNVVENLGSSTIFKKGLKVTGADATIGILGDAYDGDFDCYDGNDDS